MYDDEAIAELRHRLESHYAHFYDQVPAGLFGLSHESLIPSSGLAVISKFKLDVDFEPYRDVTKEDSLSGFDRLRLFGYDRNYGILHGKVMNGDQAIAMIATTHQNPFYADIREKQMKQLVDSFEQKAKIHPEIPLILCGDLNIERGDMSEGGERLIREHFIDHYDGQGATWFDFGNYWLKKWHTNPSALLNAGTPWTVDRSLLWSKWAKHDYEMHLTRISTHDVGQPEDGLTDHIGLETDFSYKA